MNLSVAWNRLSARLKKRDLHHTVGRFNTIRKTYSFFQKKRQQTNGSLYRNRLQPRESSVFPDVSPPVAGDALRDKSVTFGFALPGAMVQEIHDFACQNVLYEPGSDDEFFLHDVKNGQLPTGRSVLRGLVKNPSNCPAIERIAQDPVLLSIAHDYLQYWPTQVTRHLTWTFVSDLNDQEQKNRFLPLSYHYDVAGYNFMSAYFYITDMDVQTGAHVMIARSHNKKPLHTLFAPWSGRTPDQVLLDYYGQENELLIEGKAGFGFMQDPACFHKLLPPRQQNRLIFQIRYA